MRSVSTGMFRGAALLTLLIVLAVPAVYAGDGDPNPPPDARIQPPIGATSQAKIRPPIGTTSQARIQPPGGVTSQARIQPPIGALELMLRVWLLAKIGPPIG